MDTDADDIIKHLERLGAVFTLRYDWHPVVYGVGRHAILKVENPQYPEMVEEIVCREVDDTWQYLWSWGERIAPVDQAQEVADRIFQVLRVVGDR